MPREFQLAQRICGISKQSASAGEQVEIQTQDLIGPNDVHLLERLEQIHVVIFSNIPALPLPSQIDNLLVIIRQNLTSVAYINELQIQAKVRVNRAIQAGTQVYRNDITEIESVDIGVEIPADCGVVIFRSSGWRRSLFFDFGPLIPAHGPRTDLLERVLVQQESLLLGIHRPSNSTQDLLPSFGS
jgi:hypothetical protein